MMDMQKWREQRKMLPPMDEYNFHTKYLNKIITEERDNEQLRSKIVNSLHPGAIKILSFNPQNKVSETIDKFIRIAITHPELYFFVQDTDTAAFDVIDPNHAIPEKFLPRYASEFFIPWIAYSVPRAIALEVVYGYGVDICGNYRQIPPSDPFIYFSYMNDLFVAIAERGIMTKEWLEAEKPEKTVFLAAGMAPEFRHLGLTLEDGQSAIMIDSDTTIDTEWLLSKLAFKDQILYIQDDISKVLMKNEKIYGANAFVANGFISYIWDQFPKLLMGIKQLLAPGGTFTFELYPKYWEWERNKNIAGFYLPLKLFRSVVDANDSVNQIVNDVCPGATIEAYPTYDNFDNAVMVVYHIHMPK